MIIKKNTKGGESMLDMYDLDHIKKLLGLLLNEIEGLTSETNDKIDNMKQDIDEFMQYIYQNNESFILYKLIPQIDYIAEKERRNRNQQIEYMLTQYIEKYEQAHGNIPLNDIDQ